MQIWKAHYRDEFHDTDIDIVNTEKEYNTDPLSFTLDGITFVGTAPDDLHPADDTDIEKAGGRFNILKQGGFGIDKTEIPYWYTLQRYELETDIPVNAVRRSDGCEVQGRIHIFYKFTEHDPARTQAISVCDGARVYPDDLNVLEFSLYTDGKKYSSTRKSSDFETALTDISGQMSGEYYLKCCFTCQYSDYSPYGNDTFGTLQCFKEQKENYLKVSSKTDYFNNLDDNWKYRQETFICGEYEPRTRCEGYRGFVNGVF